MGKPRMLGAAAGYTPNNLADRRRANRFSNRWDTLRMRRDSERPEKKPKKETEKEKGGIANGLEEGSGG